MTEIRDGISDLVQAFNRQRRNKLAGFEGRQCCATIERGREVRWIGSLNASEQVNLGKGKGNG